MRHSIIVEGNVHTELLWKKGLKLGVDPEKARVDVLGEKAK